MCTLLARTVNRIRLVTPQLRNRRTTHAPRQHTLPHLREARPRIIHGSILAVRVVAARPPALAGRGRARPHNGVEARGVDGLRPERKLAANHILSRIIGDAGAGILGVDEAPVLGGRAPVGEGVSALEVGPVFVVDELATAAVQVLCFISIGVPCFSRLLFLTTYVSIRTADNHSMASFR